MYHSETVVLYLLLSVYGVHTERAGEIVDKRFRKRGSDEKSDYIGKGWWWKERWEGRKHTS